MVAEEDINFSLLMVEHPQYGHCLRRKQDGWDKATSHERHHHLTCLVRSTVYDYVKISQRSEIAMQDDSHTTNHDVANMIAIEPIKDIAVSFWSYHMQ